jgi:uncharacterized protein YqcC (DUF446 family)
MKTIGGKVECLLQSLQQALVDAGYWSNNTINPAALNSQQPFCLDTMNFSEWMQFVFIPRIRAILADNLELPRLTKGQGIEPMANEFYTKTEADRAIIDLIRQLDNLLQH